MESLLRATAMWGFGDLVRGLGADPEQLQRRFGIAPGAEHEDDALITLQAFARMVEACAAELDCPDFALRLSSYQGLHILGPIAVIARNAQTVQEGPGIGRPLPLRPLTRTEACGGARRGGRGRPVLLRDHHP